MCGFVLLYRCHYFAQHGVTHYEFHPPEQPIIYESLNPVDQIFCAAFMD